MHSCSVTQSRLTPYTPPGSSVHGLIQARILKWADISSFRGSSPPRDKTLSPALTGRFITSNHLGHPGMWSQVGLRSITLNEASGGDGIPVELFQILKDDVVKVLHSICQKIWKTQQCLLDWKRSVFIPIPKKGNAKECSNYRQIALNSHTSKVMLKILQSRLQQYVNCELPDVQAAFRKDRGTRDQTANICWITEKTGKLQKNIYFCFIDYAKTFDCVDHNKLENAVRDGHTRPPDLPLEKSVCRSGSNS